MAGVGLAMLAAQVLALNLYWGGGVGGGGVWKWG